MSLVDVRMRVVAAIGEAPVAEVAWACVALETIPPLKVYEGLPSTRPDRVMILSMMYLRANSTLRA